MFTVYIHLIYVMMVYEDGLSTQRGRYELHSTGTGDIMNIFSS